MNETATPETPSLTDMPDPGNMPEPTQAQLPSPGVQPDGQGQDLPKDQQFQPPEGHKPEGDTPEPPKDAASLTDGTDNKGEPDADSPPSEYAAFDLPEGVEMNEAALSRFAPVMQELGLDQEGAQKLVSAYSEMQAADLQQAANDIAQQRVSDMEAIRNDPVLGGSEENFSQTAALLNRVWKLPGGSEVNAVLKDYGLDNNPALVRFTVGIAKLMSEDTIVHRGEPGSKETAPAERMFPSMAKTP